ncbi:glycosyltransferase family 2 protein [Porphyrobacter sp. YT40]|nr:glycosyltransferase family 2 protein [Porphyrobacter sp. YT40]
MTPIGKSAGGWRLLVATPLYDGAQSDYLRAVVGLTSAAQQAGVACTFAWLSNNAAIDRARNALAAAFLQSDATHLIFIDGDIGFVPDELLDLVARIEADPALAVVGAPCPKRMVNWPLVAAAAARGLAGGNPVMLERFSGVFAFDPLDPSGQHRLDQPIEVRRVGTGLMVVRRDVIEALANRHPELRYTPDALDRESGLQAEHITALFQPMIDPDSGHLLSDDFAFCHRVRDAGFRIWIAPWMRTTHTGPARFAGTLADLAQLSAAPAPA